MSEYQDKADRLEREADEFDERSERLGEEISEVREDWQRNTPPEASFRTCNVGGEAGEDIFAWWRQGHARSEDVLTGTS